MVEKKDKAMRDFYRRVIEMSEKQNAAMIKMEAGYVERRFEVRPCLRIKASELISRYTSGKNFLWVQEKASFVQKTNKDVIKSFWEKRAKRSDFEKIETITNFEVNEKMDTQNAIDMETILTNCPLNKHQTVLDIGCGVGRLSVFFGDHCKKVVAFDYVDELIHIAKRENSRPNINYRISACENFLTDEKFDIIISSGVLAYLNWDEMDKTVSNLKKMSLRGSVLIIREPISLGKTFMIEKYSEKLEDVYSATYRNIEEYNGIMAKHGFRLAKNVKLYQKNDQNYIGMLFFSRI